MSAFRNLDPRRSWPLAVVVIVLAFAAGMLARGGGGDDSRAVDNGQSTEAVAPTRWTCSMHPQIILPSNDQKCPICFMDLIPLMDDQGEGLAPGDLRLSKSAAALAEIATAPVQRRSVDHVLRMVGKVAADETRTGTITARVAGRLDELHVDATGENVARGEPLAEIYSPRLYAAQTELRAAAAAVEHARAQGVRDEAAEATLAAAIEKMRLLGLERAQIDSILAGGPIQKHITVNAEAAGVVVERHAARGDYVKVGQVLYAIADLRQVWAVLAATERDLAWLREGQGVSFTARALPGQRFKGTILFIDSVLDERSRTVEVRVAVDNGAGLLKPGMLVAAEVAAGLGTANAKEPLVIPATAPLLTGTRAVVYVRKPGGGDPVFSGREVELGARAGDWYVVISGLEEGEDVVVNGAFKIDSALQIQARPSMMNPHGDHVQPVAAEPLAASECLRAGLVGVAHRHQERRAQHQQRHQRQQHDQHREAAAIASKRALHPSTVP